MTQSQTKRHIFQLLVAIFLVSASFAGCGSSTETPPVSSGGNNLAPNSPSNSALPDLSEVDHIDLSGQLLLPANSALKPSELLAYSTYGEQPISSSGTFKVPIDRNNPHLLVALDASGNPRLLSIGLAAVAQKQGTETPNNLSPRSTALALALLSPGFATTDPEEAYELLQLIDRLPETDTLEAAVSNTLKQNQLLTDSEEVASALVALIQSGQRALQTSNRVDPEARKSKAEILLQVSDQGDRKYLIRNRGFRWLEVFPKGEAQSLGLVPSASYSWLKIANGFNDVGELDITNAVLSRGEDVTLEIWGPGFPASVPGYLQHTDRSYLTTILNNIVGPTIGIITGSDLDLDTKTLEAVGDALKFEVLLQQIIQSGSVGDSLILISNKLVEFFFSPDGFLMLAKTFPHTRVINQVGRLFPLAKFTDLLLGADTVKRVAFDVSDANPRETFVITPFSPNLRFSTQPRDTDINAGFTPVVELELEDENGFSSSLLKLLANQPVTLSIESGPSGAILTGGSAVTDQGGFASFPNLAVDRPGEYRLKATVQVPGQQMSLEAMSVSFNVGGVPEAVDDLYDTFKNEDIVVGNTEGVLANDTLNLGTISAFDSQSSQGGTVQVNDGGSFTYTPPNDFVGQDSFTYTLTGAGADSVATVTIEVADTLPPLAIDDSYNAASSTTLTLTVDQSVFRNDELRGGLLSDYQATSNKGGIVSLLSGADGTFSYTPPNGFSGEDFFTYTLRNQYGESAPAKVVLSVSNSSFRITPDNPSISCDVMSDESFHDSAYYMVFEHPQLTLTAINAVGQVRWTAKPSWVTGYNFQLPTQQGWIYGAPGDLLSNESGLPLTGTRLVNGHREAVYGQTSGNSVMFQAGAGLGKVEVSAVDEAGQSATTTVTVPDAALALSYHNGSLPPLSPGQINCQISQGSLVLNNSFVRSFGQRNFDIYRFNTSGLSSTVVTTTVPSAGPSPNEYFVNAQILHPFWPYALARYDDPSEQVRTVTFEYSPNSPVEILFDSP